jgi:hypothetical protein
VTFSVRIVSFTNELFNLLKWVFRAVLASRGIPIGQVDRPKNGVRRRTSLILTNIAVASFHGK